MSSRKKPQQQLASYFDELLTELDDPRSDAHVSSPANKESLSTRPVSTRSVTMPSVDTPSISSANTGGNDYSPPQPRRKTSSAPTSFTAPVIEKDAVQQAKLQRLLHSLLPDPDAILPDEQKALEDNFFSQNNVAEPEMVENAMAATQANHQWDSMSSVWLDNGRPIWAQDTFDILVVNVQGINLALPLTTLDAIHPIENNLTPLFGQAEWFMGLQKILTGHVKVIDTARYIMPERYKKGRQDQLSYSVAINGSGWSLAVDEIHQPQLTYPEDIRWRVNRDKRPWVAGTVTEHMCILLDIPVLVDLLNEKIDQ
jgi:purine-binding chemotaxis protein CheW